MGKQRTHYYRGFLAVFAFGIVQLNLHASELEILVDRVQASVDSKPILYSDVQKKVDKGPLVVISEYPSIESDKPFDRALNDAVNFQLILQRAKELDIDVNEEDLEKEIQKFLTERNSTKANLIEFLKKENQTYDDYRVDFKNQIILRRFQGKVILPAIKITEKDLETFYLSKSESLSGVSELSMRQITIRYDDSMTGEQKKVKDATIKELMLRLSTGMSFEDAVKVYSDDEEGRKTGGLTKGIQAKELSPQIRQVVETLNPGSHSQPVLIAGHYRIFQVLEREISGNQEFKNKRAQLQRQLELIELSRQTNKWISAQRQRASVKILPI